MNSLKSFLLKKPSELGYNLTLLITRLAFGGMMLTHGWPKFVNYSERASGFPDPLGVGNELSMALAIFSELFCAILLMVGLGSRLVLIPLLFTMFVAAFILHGPDPFSQKELALTFFFGYFIIFVTGPGKYSLDHLIFGKKS
ncbi:MAG: DoxX family protein [Saprospirales bacterium]|nr:MAG: DoxX family protein [Saprospirales bacterium]